MGNKLDFVKEEIISNVEDLVIIGITSPTDVLRQVDGIQKFETAKRYIEIARRRIRNRAENNKNRQKVFDRELARLEFMNRRAWTDYYKADVQNRPKFLNVILGIMKRRAEMLSLDALRPQLNLNVDANKAMSETEVNELASQLKRIDVELNHHQNDRQSDQDSGGEPRSAAIRDDLPAAVHDEPAGHIPPGDSQPHQ